MNRHSQKGSIWDGTGRRASIFVQFKPCLVPFKIPKLYKIFHHIEFFNICMKY